MQVMVLTYNKEGERPYIFWKILHQGHVSALNKCTFPIPTTAKN